MARRCSQKEIKQDPISQRETHQDNYQLQIQRTYQEVVWGNEQPPWKQQWPKWTLRTQRHLIVLGAHWLKVFS